MMDDVYALWEELTCPSTSTTGSSSQHRTGSLHRHTTRSRQRPGSNQASTVPSTDLSLSSTPRHSTTVTTRHADTVPIRSNSYRHRLNHWWDRRRKHRLAANSEDLLKCDSGSELDRVCAAASSSFDGDVMHSSVREGNRAMLGLR